MIGQVGQSSALLLAITFVAGFFSIGAQLCTVAFVASFYETFLRATGVGWSVGVGRVGAIIGPVLGGLLLGAGVGTPTLFVVTGVASLGSAAAMLAMGWFVLRGKRREPAETSSMVHLA
jgi:MFS transporter, AAHS family, 4-hydroxybenzoate transporter